LRLSETSGYNNATLLNFIASADLLSASAKISGNVWDDAVEGKRHPMREHEEGGANYLSAAVIAAKNFFDYLNENNDPRLAKLFSGNKAAFFGDREFQGDSDGNGTLDKDETYAKPAFVSNMDLMLMSDWEVNFYIAEVYARASNFVKAKEYYEAGVEASLAQHGITNKAIIEAGGYAVFTATTTESAIKQIAMQKWVANCNYQHIESFLERNRTKYPAVNDIDIAANRAAAYASFPAGELTISVTGRARASAFQNGYPASPTYPETYIFRNNNAPKQKANVGEKVWWNKKTGK
ncbi:hypothetical protein SAMD00024442_3_105, partial [Candidatus Symbiothrix dinenymphae]